MKSRIVTSLFILLVISACHKPQKFPPYELMFEQTYRLTHIGSRHIDAKNAPTIMFKENGRIVGSGGCNRFNSSYELHDKNIISIKKAVGTLMMCEQEIMQQEHEFLQMLPTMKSYKVDTKSRLVFYPGSGKLLSFVLD